MSAVVRLHEPTGRNKYCGPNALSAITGLSSDDCARMLRGNSGRAFIKGASNHELEYAVRSLGYHFERQSIDPRPTLRAWLAKRTPEQRRRRCIVNVTNHYVAVQGEDVVCTMTKRAVIAPEEVRCLGRSVIRVYWLDGPARAKLPEGVLAERSLRYQEWQRKQRARVTAVKLAAEMGLRLERYSRDTIDILVADEARVIEYFDLGDSGVLAEGESAEECLGDLFRMSGQDWRDVLDALEEMRR